MAGSTSALPPLIRLLHRVSASALLLAASAVPAAGQAADPNDAIRLPPPSYPQAVAEMRAGRPTAALDALDRAARSSGAETPPLEHAILRAALLARAGRPEEAENAWREVIDGAVFMRTFARRALVRQPGRPGRSRGCRADSRHAGQRRCRPPPRPAAARGRGAPGRRYAGTGSRALPARSRGVGARGGRRRRPPGAGRRPGSGGRRLRRARRAPRGAASPPDGGRLRGGAPRLRPSRCGPRRGHPPPSTRISTGRWCAGCAAPRGMRWRSTCSTSGPRLIPPRQRRTGALWSA